jgi:type I restriction-modification system DNA methylase subunit
MRFRSTMKQRPSTRRLMTVIPAAVFLTPVLWIASSLAIRTTVTFEEEEEIDVVAVEKEIERLEGELAEVRAKMKTYLKELGV